jgi:UDP-4-amino-4,6-dideoxy-N-acetyl-beta-L-altrosamine transaminase
VKIIPYARQVITEEDIMAVTKVLHSDLLTQGPVVPAFEEAIFRVAESKHAVATNSATSALHVAYMALGVGIGDTVWTVPNTFVATANAALYCGASVDFVDIDPATYNMSVEALAAKLEKAKAEGRLPKLIAPVHFAGQSCDMEAISALAHPLGIRIVEDASHAVGGTYKGAPVGNCAYSDITIFSFHPVKIITTAEGGAALTQDASLADKMRLYRSHGVTREEHLMETHPAPGGWYYEQVTLGYNYRMTDVHAALGVSQIERLASGIAARHVLFDRYATLLSDLPVTLPWQHPDTYSALHLYPIQIEDRARIFAEMRNANILVNVHYIPVHLQPHYRRMGFNPGDFPVSEAYYERALSIPLWAAMTEAQQDYVVDTLKSLL